MKIIIYALTVFFAIQQYAVAESLDKDSQDALADTQKLLQDPQARAAFSKDSPDATKATDFIKGISKGNQKIEQDIYSLSSSIFANIVKEANGDPQKIMELLAKAQSNPSSFTQHMSPADREKLSQMAKELEGKK